MNRIDVRTWSAIDIIDNISFITLVWVTSDVGFTFLWFGIETAIDVDVDIILIANKYCDKCYLNAHMNIESNKSKWKYLADGYLSDWDGAGRFQLLSSFISITDRKFVNRIGFQFRV